MRYVIFHKPYGVLSQFTDEAGHAGLKSYLPIPGVYPVGRLDHDSEGLLLLTDDGVLANRVASPQYEHPKTYWAQVEGIPDEDALARLRQGVEIQGQRTLPIEARLLDESLANLSDFRRSSFSSSMNRFTATSMLRLSGMPNIAASNNSLALSSEAARRLDNRDCSRMRICPSSCWTRRSSGRLPLRWI